MIPVITHVFSARRVGGYLQRCNKTISLELKRCRLGAYDEEETHRHSRQRRKTRPSFTKELMW
ncbi:MAG: hypothetical protein QS748_12340 [Candidatus Endonucleobacter bathymodioli]|uniref:Uncharacterized protein n=1 Tax=Candidatus Endonucleibacter bathymodioli TaxID=539814 RepID=A0AA90SYP7_9GAMM|nr:hypothetical protein [Candidatus Endonucleobacter bathymodioli]